MILKSSKNNVYISKNNREIQMLIFTESSCWNIGNENYTLRFGRILTNQ